MHRRRLTFKGEGKQRANLWELNHGPQDNESSTLTIWPLEFMVRRTQKYIEYTACMISSYEEVMLKKKTEKIVALATLTEI